MTVHSQQYPLKVNTPYEQHISGRFVGIDAVSPTTIVGRGFTVTRTGEGVWDVLFNAPLAGFICANVTCTAANQATVHHEVMWTVTQSTRKLTITHLKGTWSGISGLAADDVVDWIHFEVDILTTDSEIVTGI